VGTGAGVQFLRWLGVGVAAALLACRPEVGPDRGALPTATPVVPVTAPFAAPAAPAGSPDPAPRASVQEAGLKTSRYAFDFEDADLPALVRLVGSITGKRYILTGPLPVVHATVHSPEPVTVDEAYSAFLAILQANGMTVVRSGEFWKIMPSPGH